MNIQEAVVMQYCFADVLKGACRAVQLSSQGRLLGPHGTLACSS